MTRGSSFLSKIGVLSLNRVATMIMNFVAVSHIARALESANFGTLMFAIAFVEYFTLAACLGFDNYLPRAVAAQPSSRRRLVGASLVVRVALSCILLPGVLLSLMFLDISAGAKWVIVIVACSMFTSAIGLTSAYQGLQRMNIVAARGFGWSLFNMLGALLFVHNEDDLVSAAIVTVASTSIVNLLVFALYVREFGWPKLRLRWLALYVAARRSSSFLLVLVLISVMGSFKMIVLGLAVSEVEVGLFAAAWRLFQMATIPINLLATVFLPLIASQYASRSFTPSRVDPSTMFFKLVVLTGLPIAGVGAAFSEQVVSLFFGPSFQVANTTSSLLMISSFIFALNTAQGTILVAVGEQRSYVRAMIVGAVVSVTMDVALIPYLGAVGAALSTIMAQVGLSLAYLTLSRPTFAMRPASAFLARCLLAVSGSIAAGYMFLEFVSNGSGLVLQLAIAGAVTAVTYPTLLWITGLDPRGYIADMRRIG